MCAQNFHFAPPGLDDEAESPQNNSDQVLLYEIAVHNDAGHHSWIPVRALQPRVADRLCLDRFLWKQSKSPPRIQRQERQTKKKHCMDGRCSQRLTFVPRVDLPCVSKLTCTKQHPRTPGICPNNKIYHAANDSHHYIHEEARNKGCPLQFVLQQSMARSHRVRKGVITPDPVSNGLCV